MKRVLIACLLAALSACSSTNPAISSPTSSDEVRASPSLEELTAPNKAQETKGLGRHGRSAMARERILADH